MKWLGPSAIQAHESVVSLAILRDDGIAPKNPSLAFLIRGAGCAPSSLARRARRIPGVSAYKFSSPT
jgi:hypothetical protein